MRCSSIDATAAELAAAGHTIEAEVRRAQAAEDDEEGPIVRLVNLIIDEAVRMRASDITHWPMADRVRVRYRIDGVCVGATIYPKICRRLFWRVLKSCPEWILVSVVCRRTVVSSEQ